MADPLKRYLDVARTLVRVAVAGLVLFLVASVVLAIAVLFPRETLLVVAAVGLVLLVARAVPPLVDGPEADVDRRRANVVALRRALGAMVDRPEPSGDHPVPESADASDAEPEPESESVPATGPDTEIESEPEPESVATTETETTQPDADS